MTAPLLPQDRYIAELLGLTEDEMRWYKAEVQRRAAEGPQPAVVAGLETGVILGIVNLVIGVGLTVVSALLAPRPPKPRERGELTTRQRQGDTLNSPGAFAPTYGFEAVQDVAPLGDPIPLVYAKREFLNGQWYGGVRINTPLLWSQIWSLGGSQMLRAVFLVGEGSVGAIHPYSFAIGNNTLGAYSFDGNLQRIAIYSVPDGGRMAIGNYLSGSQNDIGAQGQYASDIFQAEINPGNLSPVFCGAYKPSTSTSFGLYSPIANGLGYRINPRIRPLRTLQIKADEYEADDDAQAVAEAWKYKYCYSSKSGIISTSKGSTPGSIVSLDVGDTFTYMLSAKSDGVFGVTTSPAIVVNSLNSDNRIGSMDGQETLIAVGQSVAGRQKQYDSALQEGELYKAGSCLAVLIQRSPVFISEADYSLDALTDASITELLDDPNERGESAFYTFRVVRSGDVGVVGQELVDTRFFDTVGASSIRPAEGAAYPASQPWQFQTPGLDYGAGEIGRRYYTASAFPQIFRCALGSVSINRETQYFELGIRSTVAMQIQGMCNFADVPNDKKEFTAAGAATAVTLVPGEFNPTNNISGLVNGTYGPMRVYPERTSGQDMQITVVVSGGTIRSVTINDGGAGYAVNDVVVNASLYEPGFLTRFIYLRIDAIDTTVMTPSTVPGYESVNWKAADGLANESAEENLANTIFSSGTITAPEKRYSFFRIALRSDPADSVGFANMGNYVLAVAGAKETPSFNFIRFAMNGDASWEVRIEPVSSWEIRNGSFSLIELRSDGGMIGISFAQGNAYLKGRYIQGVSFDELFDIQGLRPKQEIGLSWTEGTYGSATDGTYLDRYARAAEFFMYDEISTSCLSAPEHEIAYVNVIQPNPFTPRYDNLCLIGMNVRASREWSQFSQLSAYVTEGKEVERLLGGFGATHLFPEILYDFMLNKRYGLGSEISAEQIDTASFTAAAQFCQDNRFFYDGPKINNTNWRQWASDTAAAHCLLLIERGGVFYLEEAIPEKPEIRGLFTAGNALSMELSTVEAEQRQPFSISVKYRTERYGGDAPNTSADPAYGLFPEPKERLIHHRTWGQGETESVDVSDFCTSETHAIKATKYLIAARRLSDHTVKITTTYEALTSSLAPGDFIKVAMDYTFYNEFVNGAVTGDGKLVSSTALSDGSYSVVYWTGEQSAKVVDGTLRVSNGGATATPAGVVFTVKTSEIITRTYRIDSIQPSDDGYEIEAIHSPLLTNGTLQLYSEWSTDANWVVE